MTRKRKWMFAVAGVLGRWCSSRALGNLGRGFNATELRAAVRRTPKLAAATTDEERARGGPTLSPATATRAYAATSSRACRAGDDPARAAAVAAIEKHLDALPDGDGRAP